MQDIKTIEHVLTRIKFLRDIRLEQRIALAECLFYEKLPGHQVIFEQGDKGDRYYIIKSGSVNIRVKNDEGVESIVATLFADDGFGELALLGDGASYRYLENSKSAKQSSDV